MLSGQYGYFVHDQVYKQTKEGGIIIGHVLCGFHMRDASFWVILETAGKHIFVSDPASLKLVKNISGEMGREYDGSNLHQHMGIQQT